MKSTGYVSDGGTYNVSVGVEGGSGSSSLSRNIEGGRHAKTTPSSPGRTDGDAEVEEGEGGGLSKSALSQYAFPHRACSLPSTNGLGAGDQEGEGEGRAAGVEGDLRPGGRRRSTTCGASNRSSSVSSAVVFREQLQEFAAASTEHDNEGGKEDGARRGGGRLSGRLASLGLMGSSLFRDKSLHGGEGKGQGGGGQEEKGAGGGGVAGSAAGGGGWRREVAVVCDEWIGLGGEAASSPQFCISSRPPHATSFLFSQAVCLIQRSRGHQTEVSG